MAEDEKSRGGDFESSLGLPKLSSPGDVGAASLGLALGYFGDLLLASHFQHLSITPGSASVYTSAAVLGVKNIVQSFLKWRADKSRVERNDPILRATKVAEAMLQEIAQEGGINKEDLGNSRKSLLEAINLYKDDLLSEDALKNELAGCLEKLTFVRSYRVEKLSKRGGKV